MNVTVSKFGVDCVPAKANIFIPIKPTILILGHKRHGKDTVAEILRDNYGLNFKSSSMVAAEKVMIPAFQSVYEYYKTAEECFNDRFNHRAFWFKEIKKYNSEDPTRLCKEILEDSKVYVGMRSDIEYQACKDLFDLILWVDRSDRLPTEGKDSMDINFNQEEMLPISNNNTLEDLENLVFMIMRNRL